jgi:hypothetical protein
MKGGEIEMKIPADVLKAVRELPEDKRRKVESIVRRHVEACHRMGVEIEFIDRVWKEAIEAVSIEEKFPELASDKEWPEYEPARRYDVYESPNANW